MSEKIKMYALSTCIHCKAVKRFLEKCKIEFEVTDVDLLQQVERKKIIEEVKKWNPQCSFPTIIIGDKVIVGNKEDDIKEALGL